MSLKRGVWDHRRMIVTLRTERVRTPDQVRAFVEGSEASDFTGADRESVYEFVRSRLVHRRAVSGPATDASEPARPGQTETYACTYSMRLGIPASHVGSVSGRQT